MAQRIRERFPQVTTITGDCEKGLDFPDGFFDRAIAIHVLEHLPNLPSAVSEIHRLLRPGGQFSVVIPCDGGLVYSFARRISSQYLFEKRYKTSFDWFIRTEHVNMPGEIIAVLREWFTIASSTYFPFRLPSIQVNLVIGMVLTPKPR
jgi:SAM-dependent methyltransferase